MVVDLSKLPLGALVKARKAVKDAEPESDSEVESNSDSGSEVDSERAVKKNGESSNVEFKEHRQIKHRSNKHAYAASFGLLFAHSDAK